MFGDAIVFELGGDALAFARPTAAKTKKVAAKKTATPKKTSNKTTKR